MMQPTEQPDTPLEGAQASDGAAPESVSDESRTGSSPSWWQRLTGRRPAGQETTAADGEQSSQSATSEPLKLTREELDRKVQAEVDRRESQRIAREKAEQRRRLRDEDPWRYAEQEREAEKSAEQDAGITQFFATVGLEHDRHSIDPLMEMLPTAERKRIMSLEGAGQGLAGRKLVVQEAIKALEKQWKAEGEHAAETRLRRNPAFRKQVLAEHRSDFQEPELLPASGASMGNGKVSDILRTYYGLPTPPKHNNAS